MNVTHRINAKNHKELIQKLIDAEIIRSENVAMAMSRVDRGIFSKINAYADAPQLIGYGATISAPHMHAIALELLRNHLVEGENALDVGSGSGYLTVCMSFMIGSTGTAVGIEHIPELVERANIAVDFIDSSMIYKKRLLFVTGDGRDGYPALAPYNAIHVGAATDEIPRPLLQQLKIGGRLIIPFGPPGYDQKLLQIDKIEEGTILKTPVMDVAYVPLTTKEFQIDSVGSYKQ